ncbi:MAG: preprotein translocase subunit SecY [Caldilineaceae bacterium]|nr:preprotein translocase subunit SecY [Caldilineaceae bacterium]
MLEAIRNAFRLPDLRQKLLVTIGILVLYRFAAHIPLPGVNRGVLDQLFAGSDNSMLLNLLNFFSGGGLAQMGIMALGVYPYITASIIMQLLTPIVPALEELSKEGEQGRHKINQYTYWMTVPLAVLQAIAQATLLNQQSPAGLPVLTNWGFTGANFLPSLTILIGMTAGTMFAVWLGQLLTEQGIGNGVSLIIFAGILSSVPFQIRLLSQQPVLLVIFILITIATVALIVWVQEGQRRIPVQYGKRVRTMRGNRMMMVGGQSTHIPLRVNTAGMIPLIFAQSLLILPSTVASYFVQSSTGWISGMANWFYTAFNPTNFLYWLLYFLFTVAFTYFYTDVMFRQQNLPETLQKQGGFIPGIRPGPRTESYLNGVLQRITLVGALFLGFIAVLPYLVGVLASGLFGGAGVMSNYQSLIISSAGLLIVVGVVLDTMKQIEAQLLMRNYEGFIR